MTAKGKITASKVQAGDRVLIEIVRNDAGLVRFVQASSTKTGENVVVARVISKWSVQGGLTSSGRGTSRSRYLIETTAGTFDAAPSQTLWLAPEDAAGIKRAHVEALAEKIEREQDAIDVAWTAEVEREEAELAARVPAFRNDNRAPASGEQVMTALASPEQATGFDPEAGASAPDANRAASQTGGIASPEVHTGSTVVGLLERVWERIRIDHPELPQVVIVTGSGEGAKWGHFRADSWTARNDRDIRNGHGATMSVRQHELFLASEALAKGANQVLQTMLHEAAHTLAKVRGQKDTSRQGRWHNRLFMKTAVEMGLAHQGAQADKSHGFAFVTLTQATKARYADLLIELNREIRLTGHLPGWLGGSDEDERGGERMTKPPAGEDEEEKPKSGNLKLQCMCEEPNIIRASRKVADKLVVKCDDCDEFFGER